MSRTLDGTRAVYWTRYHKHCRQAMQGGIDARSALGVMEDVYATQGEDELFDFAHAVFQGAMESWRLRIIKRCGAL